MERNDGRMNLLEVKGLYKSYSGFQLHDITFSLPKGYIMGYIGQNGAGKTTTINLITQLSNADKGEVRIDGMTYAQNPISYKEMIGYVGDEFYFPKEFKLKDIRLIMTKFFSTFQVDKFNQLVEEWKLPEKKKIAEYSRGMKVKLMFASVLSRDTKLLILDEATNGLDPVVRNDVLKILQAYIEDGEKSILFSTHI
ncbi:ABC transporter ATP-binding protein, partial [Lachnotalea glycerini]